MIMAIYIWSGVLFKTVHFSKVCSELAEKGFPFPALCVALAIALEICGAIVLVLPAGLVALWIREAVILSLVAYTLLAAVVFHNFWNYEGEQRINNLAHFLKNIGLIGAFILIWLLQQ